MKKIIIIGIFSILIYFGLGSMYKLIYFGSDTMYKNETIKEESNSVVNTSVPTQKEIDDWRLTLVNYENMLPEDYEIQLVNIDSTRQFDSRAINELNQMILDLRKDGIHNVWVQSSYRSIEYQTGLFNDSVNTYISQGKTREEAEKLTLQKINKPGTSEHNLGLAVDFNYVDYSFENTQAFQWLLRHAENYGFILRYKKEKEDITKVDYEPWHWRYVGVENAKKMNGLDMCLEEYIDYLKKIQGSNVPCIFFMEVVKCVKKNNIQIRE